MNPVGRVRPREPLDVLGTRPTRLAGDRLALPSGSGEAPLISEPCTGPMNHAQHVVPALAGPVRRGRLKAGLQTNAGSLEGTASKIGVHSYLSAEWLLALTARQAVRFIRVSTFDNWSPPVPSLTIARRGSI